MNLNKIALVTGLLVSGIAISSVFASVINAANNFAFRATASREFGTTDLNAGTFTLLGNSGQPLSGLEVKNRTLYAGAYNGNIYGQLFSVNPSNGSLTPKSSAGFRYQDFGATTSGLYAIDRNDGNDEVIEWLTFKVASKSREKFIALDQKIWTNFLAKQPGFLSKEVWLNSNKLDQITLVTHWQTLKQWKSIPQQKRDEIEQHFFQAMTPDQYILIESKMYQIRKFSFNHINSLLIRKIDAISVSSC